MAVTATAVTMVVGATLPAAAEGEAATPYPNDPGVQADVAPDYVGLVGDGNAIGAGAITEDGDKSQGLGPVGDNPTDAADVAGTQPDAAVESAAVDDAAGVTAQISSHPISSEVSAAVKDGGTARVTVVLHDEANSSASLGATNLQDRREAVARDLGALEATLDRTAARQLHAYDTVAAAVYEIDADGLAALRDNPDVASVSLDGQVQGQLSSSTGVIDSDLLNAAGVLGNDYEGSAVNRYEVAIIDSGVDGQHAAFAGRIVSQACFTTDSSCPGGTNVAYGAPAGEECTHSTDCDHGTHVGGIAAGASYAGGGHEGVARGAGIVALKVAQDNPASSRWTAQFTSIDQALQRVINLKNGSRPNLVSANLSIGTVATYAPADGACQALNPLTNTLFSQLQSLGVAVVVAAGNSGSNSQMSWPGCLDTGYAIGATNDLDVPAGFTNSSSDMDWWAPGVSIDAPVPTGTSRAPKGGTSMAAPHVAGAFALLRECVDGNGVPQSKNAVVADLNATGTNVTRNGVTRRRINVLDAATRNVNNNDFGSPEVIPANVGAGYDDFDFTVCSDAEPGEPGPHSVDNGIWYRWTPAVTGTATISTDDGPAFSTTFDTTLAVYTGGSLGTLSVVASDDDSGVGLRSRVVFPVNGGTTYRIKVDGFGAANGLLNLHVENGPAPLCGGVPATIVGTNGADVITGTAGGDVVVAGAGNDTIKTFGGDDRICGEEGDDVIAAGTGNDFVLGGAGGDRIVGQAGNDTLVGNPGGGSNDDGDDVIKGGPGDDFLDGWFGNDVLMGGPGVDQLRGEAGTDTVSYAQSATAVNASLVTNTGTGEGDDTYVAVERLTGSRFNDRLTGNDGVNVLNGRQGHDVLDGRGRNDVLIGGSGNDQLWGRLGHDRLIGQSGIDAARYDHSASGVTANLLTGLATGEGNDQLSTVERIVGSNHDDLLIGDARPNVLVGRGGNDDLQGRNGTDDLRGGSGNDRLDGGNHVDQCDGGPGADVGISCESTTSIP